MINKKRLLKLVTSSLIIGFIIGVLLSEINVRRTKADIPSEKAISKLNQIPVFMIIDKKNRVRKSIFFSLSEAKKYVKHLNVNAKSSSTVKVVPVRLGSVKKNEKMKFTYIPPDKSIVSATVIFEEDGQKYRDGVPIFVMKGKDRESYLSTVTNSYSEIPLFFEKEQLDELIIEMEEQDLSLADNFDVEVILLDELIEMLNTEEHNIYDKFTLIPSEESQAFIDKTDYPIDRI